MRFIPAPGTKAPEGTFTCSQCEWFGGVASRAFPDRHLACVDFDAVLTEASNDSDFERVHVLADNVLVDLLRWGYYIGDLDDLDLDGLIAAYDAVGKWYA